MTTTLDPPVLVGVREPRVKVVPEGIDVGWGDEAAELLTIVGMPPDDWQRDVLRATMLRTPDGKHWAARDVGLVVPRQAGKTAILLGRSLWTLFMGPPNQTCVYSSHTFRAASEFFLGLQQAVQHPALRRRVKRIVASHGSEAVVTFTGNRVRIHARALNSMRGLSVQTHLVDEGFAVDDDRWASLLPTISSQSDPQVVISSSAGDVTSTVLNRYRSRAFRPNPGRLTYLEWSAADNARSDDLVALAQANPGLPVRPTLEACEAERHAMTDAAFRRERLGVWSVAAMDPVDLAVQPADLQACLDSSVTTPPAGATVHLAFDCGIPHHAHKNGAGYGSEAAVAAAWEADGVVHGVVTDSSPGIEWLKGRIDSLTQKWAPNGIVRYNSTAGVRDVAAELERAGTQVSGLNTTQYVDCFSDLRRRLQERTVSFQPSDALLEAAASCPRRRLGEGWVPDRVKSPVSPSALVALAIACWAARSEPDPGWQGIF